MSTTSCLSALNCGAAPGSDVCGALAPPFFVQCLRLFVLSLIRRVSVQYLCTNWLHLIGCYISSTDIANFTLWHVLCALVRRPNAEDVGSDRTSWAGYCGQNLAIPRLIFLDLASSSGLQAIEVAGRRIVSERVLCRKHIGSR
ncbi:hypothetical protein K456DRAFT_602651 [Colletotrichum gloeosporioides 23]|nr:hypothetical protein K456DRAFT_602651 [Colletotrichum gloeosporioides 23]